MWLLFVEAGIALLLLVFIVWWTMFAGKKSQGPASRKPLSADSKDSKQTD